MRGSEMKKESYTKGHNIAGIKKGAINAPFRQTVFTDIAN
jgi:hypothetical protein